MEDLSERTNQNKRARTHDSCTSDLSPIQRKRIFDEIYQGKITFDVENDLFKKSSEDFEHETTEYPEYAAELKKKELEWNEKQLEIKAKQFNIAKTTFLFNIGVDLTKMPASHQLTINRVCVKLGTLLMNVADDNLDASQKVLVARIINDFTENNTAIRELLMKSLDLENVDSRNTLIPIKANGIPYSPFTMNGLVQEKAADYNHNYVFAYPFDITKHFPVLFCHPVFAEFLDIFNDRNPAASEYEQFFIANRSSIGKKLDLCISKLIKTVLTTAESQKEDVFVEEVISALEKLFPSSNVKSQATISCSKFEELKQVKMKAAVFLKNFPFIIIEAKNASYSINAVLQGLQYYGLTDIGYIDNDPCFLVTIDRGVFYLYGVAMVYRRVVCTCLLSLEFTSFHFNINGFTEKLYKCFGALYYFYEKFAARISNNEAGDSGHHLIKSIATVNDQPYPAIFSVESAENASERIMIKFQSLKVGNVDEPYFKPCVYLVKTAANENAILKLAHNYSIDIHMQLAAVGLAPKVLGYEKLCGSYHIILMEYLGDSHDNVFNHLHSHGSNIDRVSLYQSLHEIIEILKGYGIVHGDFRSGNILAKRSETNPSLLEDFKLIDFELSGYVDTLYPFLAFLNQDLSWPEGFHSYMPRTLKHDPFMLEVMKNNELKI